MQPSDGDKGAVVEEISPGSNAAAGGLVSVGDIIDSIEVNGNILLDCPRAPFDDIIAFISKNAGTNVKLAFTHIELVSEEFNPTNMSPYWENKRKERSKAPTVLRRTVGVVPEDIRILKIGPIGEGSFGTVFRGIWKGKDVVLKCAKLNVYGAAEFLDTELELNETVHRLAKGSCARFFGCCEIDHRKEGQIYNGTLTAGLWLMWEYCGSTTLLDALRQESKLIEITRDAFELQHNPTSAEASKLILYTILENLKKLHAAGIVHRDIKPDNILFTANGLVFIDLGAAAQCLTAPKNYVVGEGPADPRYCLSSDLYLLPAGAPQPVIKNLQYLWDSYEPEKFDLFSVGIIMLQLTITELRRPDALLQFRTELDRFGGDLQKWRESNTADWMRDGSCSILDSDNGAGWNLASKLLHPSRKHRVSASDAAQHHFFNFF